MKDRLVDVSVVARRFAVCDETVRAWIRARKLHAIRTAGGRYRIRLSEVDRLSACAEAQTSQTSQTRSRRD